jgi:carbamoyltransferase
MFMPYDKAILVTFDGWGDGFFSKIYLYDKNQLDYVCGSKTVYVKNVQRYKFINDLDSSVISVGHIYSIFTYLLGFTPNADEGKVEALAAYGNHDNFLFYDLKATTLVDEKKLEISFDIDKLNHLFNKANLNKIMSELKSEDIAASVQKYLEDVSLSYFTAIKNKFPIKNLCLSGGVAANVIMNMKIFEEIFNNIYIVPAMGDDGLAAGAYAASIIDSFGFDYFIEHVKNHLQKQCMPYFGPSWSQKEVVNILKLYCDKINFYYLGDIWPAKAAELICNGQIGAIFQGKMEWGPRALGNRSIIADVRQENIHKILNKEIKNRPEFQPFCPSILIEEKDRLFEKAYNNRHMTCAFKMKNQYRSILPGAIHVDGTSRVQFVDEKSNKTFYKLLQEVKKRTGFGVVINTSFNKHGRTIVFTPEDAVIDFLDTNLDFLIIEGYFVEKIKS